MMFMYTPMDVHPDKGFGVVASEFYEIGKNIDYSKSTLQHLPVEYLLRHSIELFLKSLIILLSIYKRKDLTQEQVINTFDHEHNLQKLFNKYELLVTTRIEELKDKVSFIGDYPDNFKDTFLEISNYDKNSTFFRYPVTGDPSRDKAKDHTKRTTLSKLFKKMKTGTTMSVVTVNRNDEVIDVYEIDSKNEQKMINKMKSICEYFSNLHVAVRAELYNWQ